VVTEQDHQIALKWKELYLDWTSDAVEEVGVAACSDHSEIERVVASARRLMVKGE
jgi:hypothetical protein